MKKIILISGIILLILGFSIWGYHRLRTTTVSTRTDIYTSIPASPLAILQINNIHTFTQTLPPLPDAQTAKQFIHLYDSLLNAQSTEASLFENKTWLIAHYANSTKFAGCLYTTQLSENEWECMQKLMHAHTQGFFFSYSHQIFAASRNRSLLDAAIAQINTQQSSLLTDSCFAVLHGSEGRNASANLYVHISELWHRLSNQLQHKGKQMLAPIGTSYQWISIDLDFSEDGLSGNGFASIGHTQKTYSPATNTLVERMPYNTYFFVHQVIPEFSSYWQQPTIVAENDSMTAWNRALETPGGETPQLFFQNCYAGEICYGLVPQGEYILCKILPGEESVDRWSWLVSDAGQGVEIQHIGEIEVCHFSAPHFTGAAFGSHFDISDAYITLHDNLLIATTSAQLTAYIATRKRTTQTLQCAPEFQQSSRMSLNSAGRSYYWHTPYLLRNLSEFTCDSTAQIINNNRKFWSPYTIAGIQTETESSGTDFLHLYIMQTRESTNKPTLAQEETEISLNSQAKTTPNPQPVIAINKDNVTARLQQPLQMQAQAVLNHRTGATEWVAQDAAGKLCLLDSTGTILWQKALDGPILGQVSQVDMLKNNKLQLCFTTANYWYIIDRTGKALGGFPVKLASKATAGLSVVDYEGRRDYRFFIPKASGGIWLYKGDRTQPKDWNYRQGETAQKPVWYFREQGKDYLIIKTEKGCTVLNRQGKPRTAPQNWKCENFPD